MRACKYPRSKPNPKPENLKSARAMRCWRSVIRTAMLLGPSPERPSSPSSCQAPTNHSSQDLRCGGGTDHREDGTGKGGADLADILDVVAGLKADLQAQKVVVDSVATTVGDFLSAKSAEETSSGVSFLAAGYGDESGRKEGDSRGGEAAKRAGGGCSLDEHRGIARARSAGRLSFRDSVLGWPAAEEFRRAFAL